MARADFSTPRGLRIGIVIAILLMHVAVILGLIRAFAPAFTANVIDNVTSAFIVTVSTPKPSPSPTPTLPTPPAEREQTSPREAGAAAPPGKQAKPRAVTAPKPKIVLPDLRAPQVASTGSANRSGASDSGQGTGAAGQGTGTGAGGSGSGQGGGTKARKIAGDINSARDYPRAGRDLRLGDYVIIALTVGADGRPKDCSVVRRSRDPQADAVTCELAMKRFRFRPATDDTGQPVESVYGWKQRWFYPGKD